MLANLDKLVVKPANESGGYGMLIGPTATAEERTKFAALDQGQSAKLHRPADAILSRVPVLAGRRSRRPARRFAAYILYGQDIYVLPGGLTRVALKKGSLVVNSSQGGGSKDTWVIA